MRSLFLLAFLCIAAATTQNSYLVYCDDTDLQMFWNPQGIEGYALIPGFVSDPSLYQCNGFTGSFYSGPNQADFLSRIGAFPPNTLLWAPYILYNSQWRRLDNGSVNTSLTETWAVASSLNLMNQTTYVAVFPNLTLSFYVPTSLNLSFPQVYSVVQFGSCGDGVCNPLGESCFTCPQDCQTCFVSEFEYVLKPTYNFSGYPLEIGAVPNIGLSNLPITTKLPTFSIEWTAWLIADGPIRFSISGSGIGARITVTDPKTNAVIYPINSFFYRQSINSTALAPLTNGTIYLFELEVFAINKSWDVSPSMQFSYQTFTGSPLNIFSSLNSCGDGVCDPAENTTGPYQCIKDCPVNFSTNLYCGDGICTGKETFATCIIDCAGYSSNCSRAPYNANYPFSAQVNVADDTFGDLISNQKLYRLPGVEHLIHALDPVTGNEATSPIFDITFCNTNNLIQDTYRGFIYQVPDGFQAYPYPSCQFSADVSTYSSSQEVSTDQSQSTDISASLSVAYSELGFSGDVNAAYSQSNSASTASSLQQDSSSSLSVTQATCLSSKVAVINPPFNEQFTNDINAMVPSSQATNGSLTCDAVLAKYGAFVYTFAEMGGYLEQVASTSSSHVQTQSSQQLESQISASFSAGAGGWGFSGSASASYASSASLDQSAQSDYEASTSKTTIVSYGGLPGSFGPELSSTWGSWAETVDLLPIPANYKVTLLSNLLPAGTNTMGTNVIECWIGALSAYMTPPIYNNPSQNVESVTITIETGPSSGCSTQLQFLLRGTQRVQTSFQLFSVQNLAQGLVPVSFEPSTIYAYEVSDVNLGDITHVTLMTQTVVPNALAACNFLSLNTTNYRTGLVSTFRLDNVEFNSSTVTVAATPPSLNNITVRFEYTAFPGIDMAEVDFQLTLIGTTGSARSNTITSCDQGCPIINTYSLTGQRVLQTFSVPYADIGDIQSFQVISVDQPLNASYSSGRCQTWFASPLISVSCSGPGVSIITVDQDLGPGNFTGTINSDQATLNVNSSFTFSSIDVLTFNLSGSSVGFLTINPSGSVAMLGNIHIDVTSPPYEQNLPSMLGQNVYSSIPQDVPELGRFFDFWETIPSYEVYESFVGGTIFGYSVQVYAIAAIYTPINTSVVPNFGLSLDVAYHSVGLQDAGSNIFVLKSLNMIEQVYTVYAAIRSKYQPMPSALVSAVTVTYNSPRGQSLLSSNEPFFIVHGSDLPLLYQACGPLNLGLYDNNDTATIVCSTAQTVADCATQRNNSANSNDPFQSFCNPSASGALTCSFNVRMTSTITTAILQACQAFPLPSIQRLLFNL